MNLRDSDELESLSDVDEEFRGRRRFGAREEESLELFDIQFVSVDWRISASIALLQRVI